jgi:hypothetical protein
VELRGIADVRGGGGGGGGWQGCRHSRQQPAGGWRGRRGEAPMVGEGSPSREDDVGSPL